MISAGELFFQWEQAAFSFLEGADKVDKAVIRAFAQLLNHRVLVGGAFIAVDGQTLMDDPSTAIAFLAEGFHDQLLEIAAEEGESVFVG